MSMRISVVETAPTKNQNVTTKTYRGSSRSDFYIRPHHMSRKPKSPFRKYESCVSESFKTTKYLNQCSIDMQMVKTIEDLAKESIAKMPQAPNWLLTNESCTKSQINNEERIVKIEIVNNKCQISKEANNSLCSKCKSRTDYEKKTVHFDENSNKKSKLDKIELSPKTAEQFIDILVAEDVILRKKIADGQVDDKVLKGLERISELRQKYMKYKDDEKNKKGENKNLLSYKPIMFRQKSAVSFSDPAFSQELKRHPLVKF